MTRCFILGSGTFATALATVAHRNGIDVSIGCRRSERVAEFRRREHSSLPGVQLPGGLTPLFLGQDEIPEPDFVLSVVPTQRLRETLVQHQDQLPQGMPWVSASKGIELGTNLRPTQIIDEFSLSPLPLVLSGPSHAEEVVRGVPTLVSLGCSDPVLGGQIQKWLSSDSFRVYYNADPIGVEWAGALKNIIALAAGMAVGFGLGDNTLAAIITRGTVEVSRLGVALGGQRETFSGMSGIGDLIVTCFSELSRNRAVGTRIGRGDPLHEIFDGMSQVAEGVPTSKAAVEVARKHGIDLPICEEVYRIVHEGRDVKAGIESLLGRSLKTE